jgi:SpoIID/LytB domain protein
MRKGLLVVCALLAWSGSASAAGMVTIDGRGWGHGVGMSQWGARGFAAHGWSYRQILAHYYPGTTLRREGRHTVRVLIAEERGFVMIGSKARFHVRDARGRMRTLPAGRRRVAASRVHLTFVPGAQPLTLEGNRYRGSLVVGGGDVINVLPLDQYLRGVVPWEMPRHWAHEALKAQAVAARSYALATLKHGQPFDLYADTRDQVYGGIRAEGRTTNAAIAATHGIVLEWDGKPALTYYFSTSGGRTAAARDVLPWAPRVPYLVSVADPYDSISPHHAWTLRFARTRIARLFHLPALRRLDLELNASGRVTIVRARWRGGGRAIPGREFQAELGLPSTWFTVEGGRQRDTSTSVTSVPLDTQASAVTGWIVVVASGQVESSARAQAKRLGAHVLRSDDYASLNPGYWVVYRGPYASRSDAAASARGGEYVRELK